MAVTKEMAQHTIRNMEAKRSFPPGCLARLAKVDEAITKMTTDERAAAFRWLKSKFGAEWPSDLS